MTLMLSVSGLRGIIGESLTPQLAVQYALAAAEFFKSHQDTPHPHLVIGSDSRPTGPMVEAAVISALLSSGCKVTQLGITPTPTVGFMVSQLNADGGIVITASHNPSQWNGIKLIGPDAAAPSKALADNIIARYHKHQANYVNVKGFQGLHSNHQTELHPARCLELVDVPAIQERKLKVVLHSVHGAGGPLTAQMLEALEIELIHLYAEPTGVFPHAPEPTAQNLTSLCEAVKEHGADLGLAQDPDADRLAIVDENGTYIGEEYTLALCALHALSSAPENERGPIAANLSTSRMIDDIAADYGQQVIRSAVGEANVVAAMREGKAQIGGEGNGGIIDPRVGWIRDSLIGTVLILDLLAARNQKLSEIVASIPSYAMIKAKQPIQPGLYESAREKLIQTYATQKVDTQDGVRIDWEECWVHVRPSNTEPILRVIAEAPTREIASALVTEISDLIG